MKEFHHPHVMPLIGVCLDAGPGVSIVMPYMTNGSLLDYLKKERNNMELNNNDTNKVIILKHSKNYKDQHNLLGIYSVSGSVEDFEIVFFFNVCSI